MFDGSFSYLCQHAEQDGNRLLYLSNALFHWQKHPILIDTLRNALMVQWYDLHSMIYLYNNW